MSVAGPDLLFVSAIGWCLVHFLWQAALVGAAYGIARAVVPRGNARYLAAVVALVAMAVCPAATAWHEWHLLQAQPGSLVVFAVAAASGHSGVPSAGSPLQLAAGIVLPWLVLAWGCGVGVMAIRVLRQWRGLRRMVRGAEPLPEWAARARRFADRLGVRAFVPVLASARVATPTVVGWLRPVVLLPLALLARMPAEQLDLVLAHEIAHIRRLDPAVNLFQVALETVFFYHPVVHWISRDARNERELCCDALALRATRGERRDFIAALASLEDFRATQGGLALAASGGVLVERAWFIAGNVPRTPRRHSRLGAALLLGAAAAALVSWSWWHRQAERAQVAAVISTNRTAVAMRIGRLAAEAPPYFDGTGSAATRLLPVAPATVATARVRVVADMPLPAAVAAPVVRLALVAPRLWPLGLAAAAVPRPAARPARAPQPFVAVPPVYPPEALRMGTQGQAVVEFALGAGGVPRDLRVVRASAASFGAAALQALSHWRFKTPAASGQRYRQVFQFRIGAAAIGTAVADRGCVMTTGTHICRRLDDATGPLPAALLPQ